MKKRSWVTLIIVLAFFVATGTAIAYIADGVLTFGSEKAGAQEKSAEDEADARPVEVESREVEPEEVDSEESEKAEEADLKSGKGTFVGRIDSHSVEIETDGEIRVFGLSNELRDEEFHRGEIAFRYYEDKNGRAVIKEATFEVPKRGETKTAEGIFNGFADNHTVEISINGEERAFGLDEGISFEGIDEEEEVFIAYQENEHGRIIIVKVERIS